MVGRGTGPALSGGNYEIELADGTLQDWLVYCRKRAFHYLLTCAIRGHGGPNRDRNGCGRGGGSERSGDTDEHGHESDPLGNDGGGRGLQIFALAAGNLSREVQRNRLQDG